MPGISKMKNFLVVTGGAGFVGSNLIKLLLNKTNKKIISLDNYSSGNKRNHIKNNRVKYLKADTINISEKLKKIKKGKFKIIAIFNQLLNMFPVGAIGQR